MTIYDMTIDQVIALSASFGAFLSAIATFLTVRQMSRQREASYLPELVISKTLFQGGPDPVAGGPIPQRWAPKVTAGDERELSPLFSLPLRNVGLGAAKGIAVSWSFPIEEVVRRVNDLAQRTLTPLYFTLKDGAVSIKSENLGGGTSFWGNQQNVTFDYVLPAAIQKEPIQLKVPHSYVLLASALLFVSAKDTDRESIAEIPPLIAQLEYRDIGDKPHTASFEINLQVVAFGTYGNFIHGYLESRKRA